MEILRFIFSSFWIFIGAILLLAVAGQLVVNLIGNIFSSFSREINNFYICEKNIDKKTLEEIKDGAKKAKRS